MNGAIRGQEKLPVVEVPDERTVHVADVNAVIAVIPATAHRVAPADPGHHRSLPDRLQRYVASDLIHSYQRNASVLKNQCVQVVEACQQSDVIHHQVIVNLKPFFSIFNRISFEKSSPTNNGKETRIANSISEAEEAKFTTACASRQKSFEEETRQFFRLRIIQRQ